MQDTNKLLAAMLEQQLLTTERNRTSNVGSINTELYRQQHFSDVMSFTSSMPTPAANAYGPNEEMGYFMLVPVQDPLTSLEDGIRGLMTSQARPVRRDGPQPVSWVCHDSHCLVWSAVCPLQR